jgi:hypothetical protein
MLVAPQRDAEPKAKNEIIRIANFFILRFSKKQVSVVFYCDRCAADAGRERPGCGVDSSPLCGAGISAIHIVWIIGE